MRSNRLKRIHDGDEIPAGDPAFEAMATGRIYTGIIPKEVFGIPFKAGVYPLRGSTGEIIGVVTTGRSLEQQYKILEERYN